MRYDLVLDKVPIALRRPWRDFPRGLPLGQPSPHEVGHCDLGRLDGGSTIDRGDEPGALDLCLALAALERMPTAPALAALRIAHIDDDGPMAGRAFAKVALHLEPSLLSVAGCSLASLDELCLSLSISSLLT